MRLFEHNDYSEKLRGFHRDDCVIEVFTGVRWCGKSRLIVAEPDRCILEGGFPRALDHPKVADEHVCVGLVIKETFEKDIRSRAKAKNVSVFSRVRDCVINNFGATTSLANILSDLGRQGMHIECAILPI